MTFQDFMLRQQKGTVGAELNRCERLLEQITAPVGGVRIHRKPLWYDLLYRWEFRDSAQKAWIGTITLHPSDIAQISRMSDSELLNMLEAKLRAPQLPDRDAPPQGPS